MTDCYFCNFLLDVLYCYNIVVDNLIAAMPYKLSLLFEELNLI